MKIDKKLLLWLADYDRSTIEFYQGIIEDNEKLLASNASEKKKEAAKILIKVSKKEIKECQKRIRNLL